MYDPNNIFAKILRKEIPCEIVFENDHALAFEDLYPQRKVHILVIPKGAYTDLDHFNEKASDREISDLLRAITMVSKMKGISNSGNGYRVISNIGKNGGQEIPHLHFHVFGGEPVGRMISKRSIEKN